MRHLSKIAAVAMLVALAACSTPQSDGGAAPGGSAAETALRQQQAALQRTLREGVAAGFVSTTLAASLFQDNSKALGTGIRFGAPAGLAAGSYVAALQRRYTSKEARLSKLRDDVRATNASAQAAITAMRAVLAQQTQQLASARAAGGEAAVRETAEAQENLGTMRSLVTATEARRDEVLSTRSLNLVPGQDTGVDAEVQALSSRITTMREIAELLAAEV